MNKKDLIKSLEIILNKGFCARTIHRAWREFDKIKQYLSEEDSKLIYQWMLELDPDYPDYIPNYAYGRIQFALSVKQAMEHISDGNSNTKFSRKKRKTNESIRCHSLHQCLNEKANSTCSRFVLR